MHLEIQKRLPSIRVSKTVFDNLLGPFYPKPIFCASKLVVILFSIFLLSHKKQSCIPLSINVGVSFCCFQVKKSFQGEIAQKIPYFVCIKPMFLSYFQYSWCLTRNGGVYLFVFMSGFHSVHTGKEILPGRNTLRKLHNKFLFLCIKPKFLSCFLYSCCLYLPIF